MIETRSSRRTEGSPSATAWCELARPAFGRGTRPPATALPRSGSTHRGAAPGWGKLSAPLPTRAWPRAGPVTPSPLRSYVPAVNEVSGAEDCARSLAIAASHCLRWVTCGFADRLSRTRREAHSTAALSAGAPAWNEGCRSMFPSQALRRDAVWCPSRRLAGSVSFGNAGMRDFATPNSTDRSLTRGTPGGRR
jgi:hypothetical protein